MTRIVFSAHLGSEAVERAIAGTARVRMAKRRMLLQRLLVLDAVLLRQVMLGLQAGMLLLLLLVSQRLGLLLLQQALLRQRLQLLCCEPALQSIKQTKFLGGMTDQKWNMMCKDGTPYRHTKFQMQRLPATAAAAAPC